MNTQPENGAYTLLAALLRKHCVIDAAAVLDPEGYDHYATVQRIRLVAQDWCDLQSAEVVAFDSQARTVTLQFDLMPCVAIGERWLVRTNAERRDGQS